MIIFGAPVTIPKDADKAAMEAGRARLEKTMREITERADAWWD